MEQIKMFLFLFALLVPSIILAQNSTDEPDPSSSSAPSDHSDPPIASSAPSMPNPFSFDFSKFSLPSFPGADFFRGPPHSRSPPDQPPDAEHTAQDHEFFRRVIRCNFTEVGLLSCDNCNTVRRCYPFDIGTVTTCWGWFPYCRNGMCSSIQSDQCAATSSSTSSTSTTSG